MYVNNGFAFKSFRFDLKDVENFEKKYGSCLLTPFFRKCLKKAVDKDGFEFVQSILFSDSLNSNKNYID